MKTHETMFVRDVARTYDPEVANVISESDSLVRADTFAAVIPRNHRELKQAISELGARAEIHRYIFLLSLASPGKTRQPQFEHSGVQVWSVGL